MSSSRVELSKVELRLSQGKETSFELADLDVVGRGSAPSYLYGLIFKEKRDRLQCASLDSVFIIVQKFQPEREVQWRTTGQSPGMNVRARLYEHARRFGSSTAIRVQRCKASIAGNLTIIII